MPERDDNVVPSPPTEPNPAVPPVAAPPAGQTDDQLLQTIARLAAGAAHELNNPLTVISGRAQLMAERAESETDRKTWQIIVEQSQRISDIVSNLMRFAAPPEPVSEDVSASTLVSDAISEFSSLNPPNEKAVKFDKSIEGRVPDLRVDPAQIRAVLLELFDNAANAVRTVPYIRITAKAASGRSRVLLTVRDEGPGMDAETLDKVFTPFFSHQRAGRRQGLGLSLAWRYVVNNHGRIWIESQPGQGTTVNVLLPAAT